MTHSIMSNIDNLKQWKTLFTEPYLTLGEHIDDAIKSCEQANLFLLEDTSADKLSLSLITTLEALQKAKLNVYHLNYLTSRLDKFITEDVNKTSSTALPRSSEENRHDSNIPVYTASLQQQENDYSALPSTNATSDAEGWKKNIKTSWLLQKVNNLEEALECKITTEQLPIVWRDIFLQMYLQSEVATHQADVSPRTLHDLYLAFSSIFSYLSHYATHHQQVQQNSNPTSSTVPARTHDSSSARTLQQPSSDVSNDRNASDGIPSTSSVDPTTTKRSNQKRKASDLEDPQTWKRIRIYERRLVSRVTGQKRPYEYLVENLDTTKKTSKWMTMKDAPVAIKSAIRYIIGKESTASRRDIKQPHQVIGLTRPYVWDCAEGRSEDLSEGYQVEKIVGERYRNQKKQLRVRWLGYDLHDDTWELEARMRKDVPLLVRQYTKEKSIQKRETKLVANQSSRQDEPKHL